MLGAFLSNGLDDAFINICFGVQDASIFPRVFERRIVHCGLARVDLERRNREGNLHTCRVEYGDIPGNIDVVVGVGHLATSHTPRFLRRIYVIAL